MARYYKWARKLNRVLRGESRPMTRYARWIYRWNRRHPEASILNF